MIIAIDTETTGLDPYFHGHRPFMFQYYQEDGKKGFLYSDDPKYKKTIQDIFYNPKNEVVAHNMKFDLSMLCQQGILDLYKVFKSGAKLHCTMIQSVLIYNLGEHNLEFLSRKYLRANTEVKNSVKDWLAANTRKFKNEHGRAPNYSDVPRDIMEPYAMGDVELCIKLHFLFKTPIAKMQKVYRNEMDLVFVCIDLERTGICIDLVKARNLLEETQNYVRLIGLLIYKAAGTSFNISSPKQLNRILYGEEHLNFAKDKFTKDAQPATDEVGLVSLMPSDMAQEYIDKSEGLATGEFIQFVLKWPMRYAILPLILKYRELSKMCNTYYANMIAQAIPLVDNPNLGILHCHVNPLKAVTGRFSSGSPDKKTKVGINLQNLPRILGPRDCVVPYPGCVNVHNDYSQIEIKLAVHYARDPRLKKILLEGGDIHLDTAANMFSKDPEKVSKEERKRAKSVNFGILYGAGAFKIADTLTSKGVKTSKKEASEFVRAWHKAMPAVSRLMNEVKNQVLRDGYVENEFGRKSYIEEELCYKGTNHLIQGCAADIMKTAMVKCWKWIVTKGLPIKIIMTIHDEIVFQITKALFKKGVNNDLVKLMNNEKDFFLPMTVESEYYDETGHWGAKKELTSA